MAKITNKLYILKYLYSIYKGWRMKKINSIGYGHKILCAAAICLIVIPVTSHLLWITTSLVQFQLLVKMSSVLGLIILLVLFALLKVELYQDKKRDRFFEANSQTRVPLSNGLFECQTCGNNHVKPDQRSCTVCGTIFKNGGENDGNNRYH